MYPRGYGGVVAEGTKTRSWYRVLGPGLLFAAAAVGVSHLVQSTRAGAQFGLGLVGLIVLANVVKYPAFRFGPHYAAATGVSLLDGYRRQGRWALVLYALLTVGTMFTVQAAVTFVTAALAIATLGLKASPVVVSTVLLAVCGLLLAAGSYRWLERITKVLVGVLTVATLAATVAALPRVDFATIRLVPGAGFWDVRSVAFVAALVGWMPSAIDVAVWQSLWTIERNAGRDENSPNRLRDTLLDFHIGYFGTAALAICFVIMGAGVMHGSGASFSPSAGGFAAQVIGLYTQTLGAWARPIIGVSAFFVMFSTTLTVADGFPRALSVLVARFRGPEQEGDSGGGRAGYLAAMALLMVGSLLVIGALLRSLKLLVDVATTLSFMTAPLLAWMNHRAITSAEVPAEGRPARWLRLMSGAAIAVLAAFAVAYVFVRYG